MKKSTTRELNKYLKELSKQELEKEIKSLYNKFDQVKKYYQIELSDNTSEIVDQYRQKIFQEYFPSKGFGKARNSVSRKVITDFKKISVFKKDVVELLIFRVNTMLNFTEEYGDMDEPFYNSMESSFNEACKIVKLEKLETEYLAVLQDIISRSSGIGWGLNEGMRYIIYQYFDQEISG
jgi:hypothetical protein